MLKIKDNVDLKKLAKQYNFTIEYDINTGELRELYRINGHYLGEEAYQKRRLTTVIRKEDFSIVSNERKTMWSIFKSNRKIEAGFYINSDKQDLDLLFDLIEAGLVEKVKE